MCAFSRIARFQFLFISVLILSAAHAASQEAINADPIRGIWLGSDGLTYSIVVSDGKEISVSVAGEDALPSVVPSFSPLQITATAPEMLNGLTYQGTYDPDGFEVVANLGEAVNFQFYPDAVPFQVRLALKNSNPDLSSRFDVIVYSDREMLLTRHVIRLKWQQKDPPTLVEVNESAELREIQLSRMPCAIQGLSFRSKRNFDTGTKAFMYRHIRTEIRRAEADGSFGEDAGVAIDMTSKNPPIAALRDLYKSLLNTEGMTIRGLLDADPRSGARNSSGGSEHAFGCYPDYRCAKVNDLDPDGNPFPTDTILSTLTEANEIVTGINRVINLPGKGDHLVTFVIRFRGRLDRWKGVCLPE